MRGMNCVLPPFAPDYGGICSVLYGGSGLVVIHDASGCTINFTTYDEPRWIQKPSRLFCSCLREMDAVLGDDDKLIGKVIQAAEALKPKFIALVGSSVPMLIGVDLRGIAREIECRTGIKSMGIDASGIGLFDHGASDAQIALLQKFPPRSAPEKCGVGLLGDDAISLSGEENHRILTAALEKNGLKAIASLGMGDCDGDIERLGSARVNLVVSSGGLAPAKYLKKTLGTPYVLGYPMGEGMAAEIARRLCAAEAETEPASANEKAYENAPSGEESAIILGDPILSASLREALALDFSVYGVRVGSVFSPAPEVLRAGDLTLDAEKAVYDCLSSGRYRAVVADPAFRALVPENVRFAPLPCVAVSGGIYDRQRCVFSMENLRGIANDIKEALL